MIKIFILTKVIMSKYSPHQNISLNQEKKILRFIQKQEMPWTADSVLQSYNNQNSTAYTGITTDTQPNGTK